MAARVPPLIRKCARQPQRSGIADDRGERDDRQHQRPRPPRVRRRARRRHHDEPDQQQPFDGGDEQASARLSMRSESVRVSAMASAIASCAGQYGSPRSMRSRTRSVSRRRHVDMAPDVRAGRCPRLRP